MSKCFPSICSRNGNFSNSETLSQTCMRMNFWEIQFCGDRRRRQTVKCMYLFCLWERRLSTAIFDPKTNAIQGTAITKNRAGNKNSCTICAMWQIDQMRTQKRNNFLMQLNSFQLFCSLSACEAGHRDGRFGSQSFFERLRDTNFFFLYRRLSIFAFLIYTIYGKYRFHVKKIQNEKLKCL
jgi:hypothetical protein